MVTTLVQVFSFLANVFGAAFLLIFGILTHGWLAIIVAILWVFLIYKSYKIADDRDAKKR
jgi:uncharacterized membrane protein